MPEPCYPKGLVPAVDLRAWTLVAGARGPRDRGGWWRMVEAAMLQRHTTVAYEMRPA